MKKEYVLIGAGGHGKVIIEIIEAIGGSIRHINDSDPAIKELLGYTVSDELPREDDTVIVAVGNNRIRQEIVLRIHSGYGIAIHPFTQLSRRCTIGEGTVAMAGVVVNAESRIGRHCILNTNASIDHECIIGDYAHISPGVSLAGNVQVGEGTQIGIGSSVIPGIRIGKWVTIGAGAAIIADVPDHAIVVGVPGKIIGYNDQKSNNS